MGVPTVIDDGKPDDWNGECRRCDICHQIGDCSFTDDPVCQNNDDEWWCWQCWAKRAMDGEGQPRESRGE